MLTLAIIGVIMFAAVIAALVIGDDFVVDTDIEQ